MQQIGNDSQVHSGACRAPCCFWRGIAVSMALLVWHEASAAGDVGALTRTLEADVQAGMREAQVPGVAVAIVKDGQVVYTHGFGVREIGTSKAVDAHTLFAIGSVTKSFTAASVGLLVDQHRLNWDDSVTHLLPSFQLSDSSLAAQITLRDLLSHRTGVASDNLVFWGSGVSSKELMKRFPALKITWPLRTHFDYNNLMYMAAGEVVGSVAGKPWPEFVREQIFVPLGMNSTSAQSRDLSDRSNLACAHMKVGNDVHAIPFLDMDNVAPAGAIVSNVVDMTQWLKVQLGEKIVHNRALLSEATLAEMHTAQIPMDLSPPYSWLLQGNVMGAYGFGWMLSDYHGHLLLQHGGDTDGMASIAALMPDQHFGFILLSNLGDPWFRQIVLYRLLDALLKRPQADWAQTYRTIAAQYAKESQEQRGPAPNGESAINEGSKPALSACAYAGTYRHPLYGEAVVSCDGKTLQMSLLGNEMELHHVRYDSFSVELKHFNALQQEYLSVVTFNLNSEGEPSRLLIGDQIQFMRTTSNSAPSPEI